MPFYRDETFADGFAAEGEGSWYEIAAAAGPAVAACACGDISYVSTVSEDLDDFTSVIALDMGSVADARDEAARVETLAPYSFESSMKSQYGEENAGSSARTDCSSASWKAGCVVQKFWPK